MELAEDLLIFATAFLLFVSGLALIVFIMKMK